MSNTREIARVCVRVKRKYLSGCISMGDSCGDFLSIYPLFLSIKCVEIRSFFWICKCVHDVFEKIKVKFIMIK